MAKQKQNRKTGTETITAGLPLWQHKHFYKALVLLFAFLLFVNSIPNDYNMDDELVTINHRLTSKGISAIPEIFTSPYYQDAQGYSYEYRPVVLASFAIEHQFFGDNPHVGHFFNVVLYALCCLVLYLILFRLFKNQTAIIPLAVTLLFIAHPAHTEVVCSLKNRDEILGLFFSFLSMLSALKAVQDSKKWMLVLVPVFFSLALMSKITVISFVILIPLALILFTEAGFSNVLLITLLLQIPSYFLLQLNTGSEKALSQLGITTIVSVFYVLVNLSSSMVTGKIFLYKIYITFFQTDSLEITNDQQRIKEYGFRDVFKGIVPRKDLIGIEPILITGLLSFAYFWAVYKASSMYALVPFAALVGLALKGKEKISWWANVMICLTLVTNVWYCSTFEHYQLANSIGNTYSKFLTIYLAYQLVFGKRNLFILTAVFYVIFLVVRIKIYHCFDEIPTGLLFTLLLNKYVRYALFLVLPFFIVNLYPFHQTTDIVDVAQFIVALVLILGIHFKKGGKIFPWALLAITLLSFHFLEASRDKQNAIGKITTTTFTSFTNQINPRIISTPQYRPLGYIEECVTMSDPLSVRIGTSLEICFHYLQKAILPYPLSYYYGYKFISPQKVTELIPAISLVLHLVLMVVAFALLRKQREISYALFVYIISIVVFSNYLQYVPGMLADRFLLIPSLGWCIAFGLLLQKVFKLQSNSKAFATIPAKAKYAFAGVLILYSGITVSRNFDWKDRLTLFTHDISYVKSSAMAHNLLALHLMKHSFEIKDAREQKEVREDALGHYKTALGISPFYNAAFDIGRTYVTLNNQDSAIVYFKQAIAIDSVNSDAHLIVAKLLMERNRNVEAIPYFEYRINNLPTDYASYETLSYLYFVNKEYSKSINVNKRAITQFPPLAEPLINIGRTFMGMNKMDSARIYLQQALKVSPNNSTVLSLISQLK